MSLRAMQRRSVRLHQYGAKTMRMEGKCPAEVVFTDARVENLELQSGDATDASFSEGELSAVGTPQQVETRFPSRKRVVL